MTEALDLDAIQARLDAATIVPSGAGEGFITDTSAEGFRALIAHAPTDIASLLAALREARERADRAEEALGERKMWLDVADKWRARAEAGEKALSTALELISLAYVQSVDPRCADFICDYQDWERIANG